MATELLTLRQNEDKCRRDINPGRVQQESRCRSPYSWIVKRSAGHKQNNLFVFFALPYPDKQYPTRDPNFISQPSSPDQARLSGSSPWQCAPPRSNDNDHNHHRDEDASLREVLDSLSVARQDTETKSPQLGFPPPTGGTTPDTCHERGADGDEAPPTSWSFAARQRIECARLARMFRWADQRLKQHLRGLALGHAELLLEAVRRVDGASQQTSCTRETRVEGPRVRNSVEGMIIAPS